MPGARLTHDDLEAWLDGFVPFALKRGDLAGVVIAVVKDDQVLLKKGYGYADVASKRPMDPDRTLVRFGSTAKLFTWTAVMQLVEQGKLDLDRDVNAYLDFRIENPYGKPVTMRNLMTHRGGFEEGLKTILVTEPGLLPSTEEYLKEHPRPLLFPPGEVPAYSNYGTALAGYIVQRISGEPYESYIERHIFAPLGMTRSTFRQPLPKHREADVSKGYIAASEPPRPFELLTTVPAGSLSTTAVDMTKFMIAHLQEGRFGENRILKPETARLMHSAAVARTDDLLTMAHGFFEEDKNGRRIVGHGGDTIVFHSDFHLLLDEGAGILFSFNSRGAEDSNYETREALFDGFLDRYFPAPPRTQTAETPAFVPVPEHAQLIEGRYWSSRRIESAFVSVFYLLEQDVIAVNPDGTINVPVFPESESRPFREVAPFVWREVDGERKVALTGRGNARLVFSNDDPTSALQPVPGWRSAAWNMPMLVGSILVLILAVILWPVAALRRRMRGQTLPSDGRPARAYTLARVAALVDLVYLASWLTILMPILNNTLDRYTDALDPWLRLLQFSGLVVIAAACAGIWNAWRALVSSHAWPFKLWNLLLALALVGILWFGFIAKFMSFNLNY